MPTRRIIGLVVAAVTLIILLTGIQSFIEVLPANEVMVIQSIRGILHCYKDPGPKIQAWGMPTHYERRVNFAFQAPRDKSDTKTPDESLRVQFAEGGYAKISGVVQWEMPKDCNQIIVLHTLYGSQHAIEHQLIRPAIERAMYMTGPHMTSYESYAARRPELLRLFEEQAAQGIYQTQTINVREPDPISGQDKTITKVQIVLDKGQPLYQSQSALKEFGIQLLQPSFNAIKYADEVEKQIQAQQQAQMQIQTAMAQAREAEQKALTTEANGKAAQMEAKWQQEVKKATAVTQAQQEKEVAETGAQQRKNVAQLDADAAAQYKRQQILIGEGDAERRKLLMAADNALDARLAAYVKVQEAWAGAFKEFKGEIVPRIVQGGGTQGTGNAATNFMDLMNMKAAQDMAVNPNMAPRAR